MTNKLISLFSLVAVGLLMVTACNNDVDTSAWLPNYTASGYGAGGAKPSAAGASAKPEAGEGGEGGDIAANAGAAGAP
jgi:hypothetical protein